MNKIINFLKTNYFIKGLIFFILGTIVWLIVSVLQLPITDWLILLVLLVAYIFWGISLIFFIISAVKKEKAFIIAFILFIFIILNRYFILQPVIFEGNEMEPYLRDNQYLIFQKINKSVKRGDIVMLSGQKISMVFGLPGEKVSLKDGVIFINDEPLRNISYDFGKLSGVNSRTGEKFIIVPNNSFFSAPTNQPTILIYDIDFSLQIHEKSEIIGKLLIKF